MSRAEGSGYRDLTIYDAPSVALSQMAGGQFSLENLIDTVRDPKRLAPEARKTLAERMLGTNEGLLGTVANIATNPFVIAMLFSHAPVGEALKAGASVFNVKKSAFFKNKGVMAAMGLLGLTERTLGHHAEPVLSEANQLLKESVEPALARMNQPLGRWMEREGIDRWDIAQVAMKDPVKANRMRKLEAAMMLHGYGIEDGVIQVRAPRVRVRFGTLTPVRKVSENGKKYTEYHANEIGTSTDNSDAIKRHHETGKTWDAWNDELRRLYQEKDRVTDKAARRDVLRNIIEHRKIEPPSTYEIPEPYLPEKPDYVHDLEGEDARGSTRRLFDSLMGGFDDLEKEVVTASRREMEGARAAVFGDGPLVSERMAKVIRRSVEAKRLEGGDQVLETVLDSPLGAGGAYQGEDGLMSFFSEAHRRAFKGVFPAGTKNATPATALRDMQSYLSQVEGFGKGYIPLNTFDEVKVLGIHDAPGARVLRSSELRALQEKGISAAPGLVSPITGKGVRLHPDSLRLLAQVQTDTNAKAHLLLLAQDVTDDASRLAREHGVSIPAVSLDPLRVQRKYVREARTYSVLAQPATQGMLEAQEKAFAQAKKEEWTAPFVDPITKDLTTGQGVSLDEPWGSRVGVVKGGNKQVDLKGNQTTPGGVVRTVGDHLTVEAMLRNTNLTLGEEGTRKMHRQVLNGILGRTDPEGRVLLAAHEQSRLAMKSFLDTKLGKWIEGTLPGLGKRMRGLAEGSETPDTGKGLWSGIARFFYVTHLGLNMGSMVTNLMQPWVTVAPAMGAVNTLKAYQRAFQDLSAYSKARLAKYGTRLINASERAALIRETMPHAERWGIGESYLSTLDTMVYGSKLAPKQGTLSKIEEMMMKGFEKTEVMNRLVSGHAYGIAHEASGLPKTALFRDEQARFVTLTQFGNTPTNTPQFMMSGVFSNPVVKQFLSFPVRSFTGFFHTMPQLANQNYWRGMGVNTVRAMGMSAIIYEAGKGLLGADMSRGLAASTATDLFGGEKFTEDGNGWIKVPPIVSVPHQFVSGLASGDTAQLVNAVSRLVPGGVALSRAIGVMPEMPFPMDALQKTYAGWSTPLEDGRVPVFKAGRLVDFKSPTELVMRALGADMGKFNEGGSLDGYLVKQRELIVQARQEYLAKLMANDYAAAERVASAFEKKVGVPLTVSRAQVKAFAASRNTPRTERILDRLPADVRSQYLGVVNPAGLNVPAASLTGGGTSRSRDAVREMPVSQADLERAVRRAMRGQVEANPDDRMEFGGFGG